jgi:hypothetical protein
MCDLPPMVARREGFHQQEVRLHHSRDIYRSLRRWGMGIAPWHQLPARIGPYNGSPLAAADLNDDLFVVADATAEIADLSHEISLLSVGCSHFAFAAQISPVGFLDRDLWVFCFNIGRRPWDWCWHWQWP